MGSCRIVMVLALARVLLGSGSPDVPEPAAGLDSRSSEQLKTRLFPP